MSLYLFSIHNPRLNIGGNCKTQEPDAIDDCFETKVHIYGKLHVFQRAVHDRL